MKAISSMATRHVLGHLFAEAAGTGLPSVVLEALGGVDATRRVRAGEAVDLVILADDALRLLAAEGRVVGATLVPIVRSSVAIAVPDGRDAPAARPHGAAFPSAAQLREALLAADRIGYSTGPSGTALVRMIEGWGLTDELGPRLVQGRPGVPVAGLLAAEEVDIGLQQLSELVGQPRIRILGVLPQDSAIDTIFSGAVASTATDPAGSVAVLDFLTSAPTAPIKAAHSFLPV